MFHCFNSRISSATLGTWRNARSPALLPQEATAQQHTLYDDVEIYIHSELEFISFDWEHGVMENILMFYVPYIRKCYNPKNYIKYKHHSGHSCCCWFLCRLPLAFAVFYGLRDEAHDFLTVQYFMEYPTSQTYNFVCITINPHHPVSWNIVVDTCGPVLWFLHFTR